MRTLTGLDDRLTPVVDEEQTEVMNQMPTYRRMYRIALGNCMAKTPDEAVDLMQVGLKLRMDQPAVKLEDAEFKLLSDAVVRYAQAQGAQMPAHLFGQLVHRLRDGNGAKGA